MARTTAPARWQRVQTFSAPHATTSTYPDRASRPGGVPPDESPIYEELVRQWAAAGRTLPGANDLEWARLVRFPPPQAAPPDPFTGSPSPYRGRLHLSRHPA
ncbi:hypothetical protein ACFYT4_10525 [Streptomyces sp. NPDC004609]|uniref:hypothetical protein n=1 Tax=Streptomyces sp. NPDC004609 TaxID=3364704 RepID=UPI00369D6A1B